jgi:hypothetical protein
VNKFFLLAHFSQCTVYSEQKILIPNRVLLSGIFLVSNKRKIVYWNVAKKISCSKRDSVLPEGEILGTKCLLILEKVGGFVKA